VTMHRNKFLYNKTIQMHQFTKFTPAWNSTCFGQFLCPSSGVYSLYTRHWYMSYRFEDRSRAGHGRYRNLLPGLIVHAYCTAHPVFYWVGSVYSFSDVKTAGESSLTLTFVKCHGSELVGVGWYWMTKWKDCGL
jgi:hypothetical protein